MNSRLICLKIGKATVDKMTAKLNKIHNVVNYPWPALSVNN